MALTAQDDRKATDRWGCNNLRSEGLSCAIEPGTGRPIGVPAKGISRLRSTERATCFAGSWVTHLTGSTAACGPLTLRKHRVPLTRILEYLEAHPEVIS